jgi:hypothetical protein
MTKCPAMIVHVIFAIIVVALSAVLSSQVKANQAEDVKGCNAVSELGGLIMQARLDGDSFSKTLDRFNNLGDGAFSHASFLVTDAYNLPMNAYDRSSRGMREQYSTYVFYSCMIDW